MFAMENIDNLMVSEEVTWRDILYNVLADMDPWDVNIIELATRYSQKVDEMKEMNFRLPANVILVCSVLLRMKADILAPDEREYEDFSTSLDFIFNSDYPVSALVGSVDDRYPIAIKPARTLTRKVTADELITAIQDALAEKTKRIERIQLRAAKKSLEEDAGVDEVYLEPQMNILEVIEETYALIMTSLTSDNVALFSQMAKTREDVLKVFLSLLHLSNSDRVDLTQETLFGEIYIKATG